jgi:hypothetical protein
MDIWGQSRTFQAFFMKCNFLYVGVLLRNANTAFSSDGAVGDSQLPKLSIEQKN